jgi:hypothetical protein
MRLVMTLALISSLAIHSCKAGSGFTGGSPQDKKKTTPEAQPAEGIQKEVFKIAASGAGKIDIAFVLDTSLSMKEETNAVQDGLQGFVDKLTDGDSGIDYQLFVIASTAKTRMSLKDSAKLDLRNVEVNSHSGLWHAYHFLEGHADKVPLGHLKLRADAIKELVFLSDDDARNITSDNFGAYLKKNRASLGEVRVNAFVALTTSRSTSTCKVAGVGNSYIKLGNDLETGGYVADICTDKWNHLLTELASSVKSRSGRGGVLPLKATPSNPANIKVLLDGQDFRDFTYNSETNSIVIDVSKLSDKIHHVDVNY